MMEQTARQRTGTRKHRRWWRPYIAFLGASLLIYFLLVLFLTVLIPSVIGAPTPLSTLSVSDRILFATDYLIFGQTTWPAIIGILIPSALMLSLYLSKLAGPLYRFQLGAGQLQQGNLSLRIRLRSNDQPKFKQLAQALNEAIARLDQALAEIRDRQLVQRSALRQCFDAMRAQPSPSPELLAQLELAIKEGEQIEGVLQRFTFSSNESRP